MARTLQEATMELQGGGQDPMAEKRINYLYQMSQMNPKSTGMANAYMQSYMDYMYPQQQQANPFEDMIQQYMGGGQQPLAQTWKPGQGTVDVEPNMGMEVPDAELQRMETNKFLQMQAQNPPPKESFGAKALKTSYMYPGRMQMLGGIGSYLTGGSEGLRDYGKEIKGYWGF